MNTTTKRVVKRPNPRIRTTNPRIRLIVEQELRYATLMLEQAQQRATRSNDSDIRLLYTEQWTKSLNRVLNTIKEVDSKSETE